MSIPRRRTLPLVARCIQRLQGDTSGFVEHDDIVSAILDDRDGAALLRQERNKTKFQTDRIYASSWLQWFSQTYPKTNSFADLFDREERKGGWAYRVKSSFGPLITPDPYDLTSVEGDARLFVHFRRERNPALARAKRKAMRRPDGPSNARPVDSSSLRFMPA